MMESFIAPNLMYWTDKLILNVRYKQNLLNVVMAEILCGGGPCQTQKIIVYFLKNVSRSNKNIICIKKFANSLSLYREVEIIWMKTTTLTLKAYQAISWVFLKGARKVCLRNIEWILKGTRRGRNKKLFKLPRKKKIVKIYEFSRRNCVICIISFLKTK